ncbi:MAG: 8-amino-7-oxononanoate synthase [Leptolyngbya sp. ERB_1_1]
MKNDPYAWIELSLGAIDRAGWHRSVKTIDRPGAVIQIDEHTYLNFASNDYLGLATDDRLIHAAIEATQQYGTGSTGSRLLTGHRPLHRALECAIAQLKQTEDAIVFSSGYLANLGTIAALVGKRDLILSDQYNHSSLRNGAIVSGATILEYQHCEMQDLRAKLEQQRSHFQRCLILTDTVFSMDGDLCPLPEILDLANQFECMVLVDEAHATGIMGATGAGCVEHFGATGRAIVQMGTLSKALGSLGGYVAGSASLIDFLRNRAPSWIYTTGLSPADTAAALCAIEIVQQDSERRSQLWQNVTYLKSQLPNLTLLPSNSPILCWQLPNVQTALQTAQYLQNQGIFAPAIRPPTVPTSRIRMTVMATHTKVHLDRLIQSLENSGSNCW